MVAGSQNRGIGSLPRAMPARHAQPAPLHGNQKRPRRRGPAGRGTRRASCLRPVAQLSPKGCSACWLRSETGSQTGRHGYPSGSDVPHPGTCAAAASVPRCPYGGEVSLTLGCLGHRPWAEDHVLNAERADRAEALGGNQPIAQEDEMNPQLTYMLAVDRARDLRRDAEKRGSAAKPSTTSDRSWTSLRVRGTAGRPSFLRRLRAA